MHAARRRRRRDGFSRTRDGRAPRSQGPGRRGTGGRPLTSLPKRWRRFGDRRRFVSDDTLGRGDAAARGDRHPGFGRARSRPGRGRRGLHHLWPIGAGPRRGLPVLLLIGLVGPQDGWALGRRGRRLPGRGALGTDRLAIRLLGLRLCVFDHRQRGLRPCVFDHRQRGLRPCVFACSTTGSGACGPACSTTGSGACGPACSTTGSGACGPACSTTGSGACGSACSTTGGGACGSACSTTGGGGGGGGGFSRPSRDALRRTRSAWASTMLEEWDLIPMLSATQSSSVS